MKILPRSLAWASLVPLLFLLRPYAGLAQDARIYLGRGVADHDPAGLARDILFSADGQTGFSLMRLAIDGLLDILSAPAASMLLAVIGLLAWLAAAVALFRRVAAAFPCGPVSDRVAWAMTVAVLALPGQYGALGSFAYGEAIATPRIFAEASTLAALALLLGGRRLAGSALLALALALHPLMALPGIGLAAMLLAREDRRWLIAAAAAVTVVLVSGAFGLPVADRLFVTVDEAWWAVLRHRSANLFPSLWPMGDYARIAVRGAAVLVTGTFAAPRARALLWGGAGLAAGGVATTFLFGDVVHDLFVTQVQPWRALWLLTVLGNAGVALAAVDLWRRGHAGRLVLATLVIAQSAEEIPGLALAASAAAVALAAALRRGGLGGVTRLVAGVALAAAALMTTATVAADAAALCSLFEASAAQGGDASWAKVVEVHVLSLPLLGASVAAALSPDEPRAKPLLGAAALVAAFCAGLALWDQRSEERRGFEDPALAVALRDVFGPAPGAVLWIGESAETWFDLDRPAFFNKMQGGPILFSREMALEWAERGATLEKLGLARPSDLAPWAPENSPRGDLRLMPGAVERFCADPRRPAGLVAPGDQSALVPPGFGVAVWRPPFPIRRMTVEDDGFVWRRVDAFTAVRCG